MLIAVDGDALGPALKWETSRGGALFPHLYAALPLTAVRWAQPLPDEIDGRRALAGARTVIGLFDRRRWRGRFCTRSTRKMRIGSRSEC